MCLRLTELRSVEAPHYCRNGPTRKQLTLPSLRFFPFSAGSGEDVQDGLLTQVP